ncbi:MAG TPA: FixH family protein, partial [Moraxellaceae bacterium]|nr:FixH family protein [Moraxellaceae bacterium]
QVDAETGELTVAMSPAMTTPPPEHLTLYFQHPTQASADENVVLTRRGDSYAGHLPAALHGRFHVELGSTDWRLLGTREFPAPEFTLTHE